MTRLYIRGMAGKSGAKGGVALALAAVAFVFTVWIGVWNNDHHPSDSCDTYSRAYHEDACRAQKEDKNLLLISGAVTVGLLGIGLVRRYQPGGRAPEDAATKD